MAYRTDLKYENGQMKVSDTGSKADARQPLPNVEASNLVTSGQHGQSWKEKAGINDNALDAVANAQAGIARSFNTLMQIRQNQDPEQTQASHLNSLSREYERAISQNAESVDRSTNAANARLQEIEKEARAAVNWDTSDLNALRASIKERSPQEKAEFISEAIAEGDGNVIAAILGGHPDLVGLNKQQQRAYRQQIMSTHTPQLLSLENSLIEGKKKNRDAFVEFLDLGDSLTAKSVRDSFAEQQRKASEARRQAENGGGNIGPSSPWDDLVHPND